MRKRYPLLTVELSFVLAAVVAFCFPYAGALAQEETASEQSAAMDEEATAENTEGEENADADADEAEEEVDTEEGGEESDAEETEDGEEEDEEEGEDEEDGEDEEVEEEEEKKKKKRRRVERPKKPKPKDVAGVFYGLIAYIDPERNQVTVDPHEGMFGRMSFYVDKRTRYTREDVKKKFENLRVTQKVAVRFFGEGRFVMADEIFIVDGEYNPEDYVGRRKRKKKKKKKTEDGETVEDPKEKDKKKK